MLLLLATLAHGAETWNLQDLQPKHDRHTVLVVATPGYAPEAFRPLAEFLVKKGHDVRLLSFPCLPDDASDYRRSIDEAAGTLGEHAVVAHGLGATLVLGTRLGAEQLALLGPVLAPARSEAADLVAGMAVGPDVDLTISIDKWTSGRQVNLSVPRPFGATDAASVLLGEDPPLQECASGPLAAEVQRWYLEGPDVDLASIATPTWIGVGLLDRLSPVEVLVPASRELPNRRLLRLGITRLDGKDLDHLGLLRDKVAHKAAYKALKKGDKLIRKQEKGS
ncbi:MAG: hypothetical protein EP330_30265 [Deltaproteobacteria bacterium]|nr:MAG: hypothetical protein EP330_30265 [Deltaproteobacteria bacterium]